MTVEQLQENLEAYWGVSLTLQMRHSYYLQVASIVVPREKRNRGIGSQVMRAVCTYADTHNLIVGLTPALDFGATSVTRLRRFYSQFGFKRNYGNQADPIISEAMIRRPKIERVA